MACGTPVVASRATSLGEVIGNAGLLADPYDATEIARAMDAVASDTHLRAILRERGLARAKDFTWEKSAAVLSGVFEKVIG
jgi:glycosyltransferase involved in cell wall biosynthesis